MSMDIRDHLQMRGTGAFLRRCLSLLLAVSMLLPWTLTARAAENGLCEHHQEHTPECGYRAPSEGVPCDRNCTDTDGDGVVNHMPECAYQPEKAGAPCTFRCEQCEKAAVQPETTTPPETTVPPETTTPPETTVPPETTAPVKTPVQLVQELIDALPDTVTAENAETVRAQLVAIDQARTDLTDDEQDTLVITKYASAGAALQALEGSEGAGHDISTLASGTIAEGETVYANSETIQENRGTVTINYGTIVNNYGEVTTNRGIIENNMGTIGTNEYKVNRNSADGTINCNIREVDTNNGKINVVEKSGTVRLNERGGTIDLFEGTMNRNLGKINENTGTVTTNEGEIYVPCSVSANDDTWGTVTGGGSYLLNKTFQVTAVAKPGYRFSHWVENGSRVSEKANDTFTASGSRRTLTAVFEKKKISVRMQIVKGSNPSDVVTGGDSTGLGATHEITIQPDNGYRLVTGYFAGEDYYTDNPTPHDYQSMTLNKTAADPGTGAVTYQFTATEYIPIATDPDYDYICLYFYCASAPTLEYTFGDVYNKDSVIAPTPDGTAAAVGYESQYDLCADPGELGYYRLNNANDRSYLTWDVESITNAKAPYETLGGTVSFENNRLHYTPTAAEAGKTVRIQVRPKLGDELKAADSLTFEIEVKRSSAAAITDVSAALNAVKAPEALEAVQTTVTVPTGSHYTAEIAWTPEETSGKYGFETEYTATLTLSPAEPGYSLHSIDDTYQQLGWHWKIGNPDGSAVITKKFPATRKERLASLDALDNVTLTEHTDKEGVIAGLPKTITASPEISGAVQLPLTWSCDNYNTAPEANNIFTWTATNDSDYETGSVLLTGTITVTNPGTIPVVIQGTDTEKTYDGSPIDVSNLFAIDTNAGEATYTVTEVTGSGTCAGSTLTVTKAGKFEVTVNTKGQGLYAPGMATATLTVKKGKGACTVTMDGWIYGGEPEVPVSESKTNASAKVTYTYTLNGADIRQPKDAGTYTVTAVFGATDLYESCTASAEFTIAQKPITVTITSNGGVEGQTFEPATAALNGVLTGETAPDVTLTYTGTDCDGAEVNSDQVPQKAGIYTVTASIPAGSYVLDGEVTAAFIVKRPITATVTNLTKTYGDPDPKLAYTVSGTLLDGKQLDIQLTRASGENVGDYAITATDDIAAKNPAYAITLVDGKLTIEAKPIDSAQVLLGPALTANGTEQTQEVERVTVKNSRNETLEVTTYTVTGSTGTEAGVYTMTITGTGNFTGKLQQTFVIAPAPGQQLETDGSGNPVLGAGTIIQEINRGSGAPSLAVNTSKSKTVGLLELTAQELAEVADGAKMKIIFEIQPGVAGSDRNLIQALADERKCTVGSLFDISVYKKLENGPKIPLSEAKAPIPMSVQVPDNLINTNSRYSRTFYIVRCCDGKAELLRTSYNSGSKTLTFSSDKFGSYGIVYKDSKKAASTSPDTGDSSRIELWICVLILSLAAGTVCVIYFKRKK